MSTSKSIFHSESILGIDAINVYKYGPVIAVVTAQIKIG
jgi:hypothetical protein